MSEYRTVIRQELEVTRVAFKALIAGISANDWENPTSNPAWNVRQLAWHIIMALQFLPADIKLIRKGRSFSPPPKLFNWINKYYTRWAARKATSQSMIADYDHAHDRLLMLIDDIADDEWLLSMAYPNLDDTISGGQHTIVDMFHYIGVHFDEHERDIRQNLGG